MASTIAYIIYILTMAVGGFVLASAGLTLRTWQYWIMLFSLLTVYLCGYIRGGA